VARARGAASWCRPRTTPPSTATESHEALRQGGASSPARGSLKASGGAPSAAGACNRARAMRCSRCQGCCSCKTCKGDGPGRMPCALQECELLQPSSSCPCAAPTPNLNTQPSPAALFGPHRSSA
jgi:hypothetical protein